MEWFNDHRKLFTTTILFFLLLTIVVAILPALNNEKINRPLPGAEPLSKDAVADITIIDPDLEWTVDKDKFYTKGSHSPFVGRKLKGKAISTIVAGRIIMQNGIIIK